jgi:hypothetical protein
MNSLAFFGWLNFFLNLVWVDNSSQIWVCDKWSQQLISVLEDWGISVCSEQFVEVGKSALSPDDESS